MSYFPCDIPYMSEEELIENGIKIHRDASQIICNKCKHYQGVHDAQGHAPCDYWKSGSVQWNEHCSHAELYKGAENLYDSKYRWINVHGDCQCPDCGYIAEVWWLKEAVSGKDLAPHCPNCGADMRLRVNQEGIIKNGRIY